MIINNADDVSVLFDPLEKESYADRLIDYLPHSRKGSVVFTTRTQVAAIMLAESNVIGLGGLKNPEAKEVLRKRLLQEHQHQLEDEKIVDEFLDILAFLALAIVQAVAFINTNGNTLSDYISHYKSSKKDATDLLSEEFEDKCRHRDTKNPVATTWYISFELIWRHNELAAKHLSFMACTASNDIPASMLIRNSSRVEQTEAIGMLKAYAFITERQPQRDGQRGQTQRPLKAFDVHPLVHLAMRGWLRAYNQWNLWVEKTLKRLVEVVPFGDHDKREIWVAYLPHAIYVVDLPEVYEAEARMPLLDRIGRCNQTVGRYKAAERAYQQLLERREMVLGKEHPLTLASMSNLAQALSRRGKYAEAEKMNQETLALREKVLRKKHPETLTSMNNLARTLSRQGKYAEAEKMNRETLALRKKVLGKKHPHALVSMHNLARALSCQGKHGEAEEMHRETLALREKVLGKEHPHTLVSMNDVGLALSCQGKHVEAEEMSRETLALRKKVSGKEHPETLTSMNNLAQALSDQGKHVEAEEMHRETLAVRKKVLGKKHPHALVSMHNLAQALSSQGKHQEAEETHRETLALREKVSRKEHPETLTSMNNLAWALSDQGKCAETLLLMQQCFQLRKEILGPQHPHSKASLRALNKWQMKI